MICRICKGNKASRQQVKAVIKVVGEQLRKFSVHFNQHCPKKPEAEEIYFLDALLP
jgi:hypothetical protein